MSFLDLEEEPAERRSDEGSVAKIMGGRGVVLLVLEVLEVLEVLLVLLVLEVLEVLEVLLVLEVLVVLEVLEVVEVLDVLVVLEVVDVLDVLVVVVGGMQVTLSRPSSHVSPSRQGLLKQSSGLISHTSP
jgi:hypothetical protein